MGDDIEYVSNHVYIYNAVLPLRQDSSIHEIHEIRVVWLNHKFNSQGYPTGRKFSLESKFGYFAKMANSLNLNSVYYYIFKEYLNDN